MNILKKFMTLGPPSDSKSFLSNLKEILKEITSLDDNIVKNKCLQSLVGLYLECPSKFPVKRIMASFFQNLNGDSSEFVQQTICQELIKYFELQVFHCDSLQSLRHFVDAVGSLLENFKLGESCILLVVMPVLKYLVQAGNLFLSLVQSEVAPVKLHQTMQHCHVTIQTINLVLQKSFTNIASQVLEEPTLMTSLLDFDLLILKNESFLLDCRCCCAMNIILLLQLLPPDSHSNFQFASLLLPKTFGKFLPCKTSWLTDPQAASLDMDSLSLLSYLALSFGYIAMVSDSTIKTDMPEGQNFYIDCLLPNLLGRGNKCNDTASKALLGKTISLWSSKLYLYLEDCESEQSFVNILQGKSNVLPSLLDYVWTHWEDQLDVIRQSAKSVFENVLKIHIKISKCNGKTDSFVTTIMTHLFSVSWTCKGKFSALNTCVQLIGASQMLSLRPQLPSEVVEQLEEQSLSCYTSELYSTLFVTHHQELSNLGTDSGKTEFQQTWLEPIVMALCSDKSKLKQNLVEYLLVKLLKDGDDILEYLIAKLSKVDGRTSCGAIIMCLRKARILGLLKAGHELSDEKSLWYGHLHPNVLKTALCSSDLQIRLDAFGLLCENHKTTEPVSDFEFKMLKFFIPCNLNNQSPAFRQALLSLCKKFFSRSKDSLVFMKKQISKNRQPNAFEETIHNYQAFFTGLTYHLLSSLYPGSAFARRTTSLAMLSLLTSFFSSDSDVFTVTHLLNEQHRQVLLECITDTFEENKKESFTILSAYMQTQGPVWDQIKFNEIFETSVLLACSTRPQDCETAVYNFLLILKQLELHTNTFKFPETLSDGTPVQTCGVNHPVLNLLTVLLNLLDDEISVAGQSLITAAARRPMYPTLLCIRYIMPELDYRILKPEWIPEAKTFISHLIKSCLTLSRIVSPVVQNSSPEGNMPEDVLNGSTFDMSELLDNETKRQVVSESDVKNSQLLVESMPEYLVVCCWRSIKEVSLTLGKLCLQIPVNLITENDKVTLLTFDQVKVIGDYFSEQLLESIHRGAFELAYAGFQLMCQMLWSHPSALFHQLPARWLSQVMLDIKSEDSSSKFCITRRSAGVPFFIQAITSQEPVTTGRKCFHQVMKELLNLAVIENDGREKLKNSHDSQIHAVNILRALYKDARLGEDVLPYVADGLKASILAFKSELWAVRNSSTLLLSALMTRIFGVKRSKDETAISKKNCQSGRSFFHQYPGLYPFLLSELMSATENIQCKERLQLHPSLYPVLLVLGRLYPSTIDNPDTNMSLSSFIPFVIRCASSPVYKTRIIASRALLPLVRRNDVISISQKLLANIPKSCDKHVSNSLIHGSLLQLCQLMKLVPNLDINTKEEYLRFMFTNLNSRTWLFSSQNSCCATWQLALDLADCVLEMTNTTLPIDKTSNLCTSFLACLSHSANDYSLIWKPLYVSVQQTMARLSFKYLSEIFSKNQSWGEHIEITEESHLQAHKALLLKFLLSSFYEVRLCALDAILSAVNKENVYYDTNSDTDVSNIGPDLSDDCLSSVIKKDSSLLSNRSVLVRVADHLFSELLDIGLHTENYHLCLEKTFYVLASIPNGINILMNQDITDVFKLFTKLLVLMNNERRLEVKAAVLKFSSQLVSVIYTKLNKCCEEGKQLVTYWTQLVKSYCRIDDSPVLQVSCCQVLFNNVKTILLDPENKLGDIVFDAWDCLAYLLQEDDLDVKEIAASIFCVVCGLHPGSCHPSYALHCLPSVLIKVHGQRNFNGVLACLIGWIMLDSSIDIKESSERLFDKGEMNTYLDTVSFTHCIVSTLTYVFSGHFKSHPDLLLHSHQVEEETCVKEIDYKPKLTECLSDESSLLNGSFTHSIDTLKQGLECLLASCLKSDIYLNCGRYMSLCTTVFKARMILKLLSGVPGDIHPLKLHHSLDELLGLVNTIVNHFELKNMLTTS
ncbi:hypothetical protein Btru_003022 [Bulinus truncatus]|nr:hypothetical protein Btru_003022 [Bulinus truncatus]